jgi:hypothetical protein
LAVFLAMPHPELVGVLDYILNRCDEHSIEAVAAAVVRRRRQLTMFGGALNLPDSRRMAQEISAGIDIGGAIKDLKASVRDMTLRVIRQEAPELSDEQVRELAEAWMPEGGRKGMPEELLRSMIDQFVAFSQGTMDGGEDRELRDQLGSWPERYWKAFPPVIRLFITEYLKGKTGEKDFRHNIDAAFSAGF